VPSTWSVAQLVSKNSHTLAHVLKSQLKQKHVHHADIKTLDVHLSTIQSANGGPTIFTRH